MTLLERYQDLINQRHGVVDTVIHLPYLREQARGAVLEIGVAKGNSTTALLLGVQEKGGTVCSLDIQDCSALFDEPQWIFRHTSSLGRWWSDWDGQVDVAYIDGDHSYEAVKSDLTNCLRVIKPNGVILLHDVLHPDYPGVRQAFDEAPGRKEIREGSWGLGVIRLDSLRDSV